MSFINSYKQLEKLCSEIYDDNHGVTAYIDEMINNPIGSCYVCNWKEDLKQLKHYRWVRNQIVHEPGCTEENMCKSGDVEWLDDFHSRIIYGNDPLSLYYNARNFQRVQQTQQTYSYERKSYTYPRRTSRKLAACLICLIYVLVIVIVIVAAVIITL